MINIIAIVSGFIMELIYVNPIISFKPDKFIRKRVLGFLKRNHIEKINTKRQYKLGVRFTIYTIIFGFILAYLLFLAISKMHFQIVLVVKTIIYFLIFSANTLFYRMYLVQIALKNNNTSKAIELLQPFSVKDLSNLSKSELVLFSIKCLAENITEFIISPIFYTCIGGIYLGLMYRLISITKNIMVEESLDYLGFKQYILTVLKVLDFIPNKLLNIITFMGIPFLGLNLKSCFKTLKVHKKQNLDSANITLHLICLASLNNKNKARISVEKNIAKISGLLMFSVITIFLLFLAGKIGLLIYLDLHSSIIFNL